MENPPASAETRVPSLDREDPSCGGAAMPGATASELSSGGLSTWSPCSAAREAQAPQ